MELTKEQIVEKLQTGVHLIHYVTKKGDLKRTFATLDKGIVEPLVDYVKVKDSADNLAAYIGRDINKGEVITAETASALLDYDEVRTLKDSTRKENTDNVTYFDLKAKGFRVFTLTGFQAFVD